MYIGFLPLKKRLNANVLKLVFSAENGCKVQQRTFVLVI